jgi:hypothetical protein
MEKAIPKEDIKYRILQIEKLSHFENDYTNYGLSKGEITKCDVELAFWIQFDDKDDSVSFLLKTIFSHPKDKKFELFGIKCVYKFEIKDLSKKYKGSKENQYRLSDELMSALLNMSISGMRGMLSVLITKPAYRNIILPPFNAKKLLANVAHKTLATPQMDKNSQTK